MSQLAQKLATAPAPDTIRRGPANQCYPLYGAGDLEDWDAIETLRKQGHDWRSVQALVDTQLGVDKPLVLDKFRYHWRRKCFCWVEGDRL